MKQVSLADILSSELSPEDTVELLNAAGYKEVKHGVGWNGGSDGSEKASDAEAGAIRA